LKGLFFAPATLFMDNFKYKFYDDIFDPFWKEVDSLSIPLYAQIDDSKDYCEQIQDWSKVLERYPSLTMVISLGLPFQLGFKEGKPFIPEIVKRLVTEYKVYLEIAYPISIGRNYEYPYQEAQQLIRHLYNTLGANRLVWGSDIPNVERHCTYAQSLNYLKDHCNFISMSDKELILGKNVIKIFSKN
jgi:predicted TIM-barrel fold metal-dependent hydrolase